MNKNLIIFSILIALTLGYFSSTLYFNSAPVVLQSATWFGEQAKPIPEFKLTDHNGKAFNPETLKGKWHLLFFGYTNCPDICPETLSMLATMYSMIEDEEVKKQLQLTFISVDPDRDDIEKMKTYVTYFNKYFLSARGDIEEVKKLSEKLGILHYIVKSKDGEVYNVAHSGALTLIDPEGRFTGIFSTPHDSSKIANDLTLLING